MLNAVILHLTSVKRARSKIARCGLNYLCVIVMTKTPETFKMEPHGKTEAPSSVALTDYVKTSPQRTFPDIHEETEQLLQT